MSKINQTTFFLTLCTACVPVACSKSENHGANAGAAQAKGKAADIIRIDGSSTVYPITQIVAEDFEKAKQLKVTIGVSGTGGGFKKFCRGETVISGASRPIKETERKACADAGIDFVELPVAYDGLAVVVNPDNEWVDSFTVEELKKMWAPEAAQQGIKKWSQIRSGWPDEEFHLFGPGVDSGTYDYFTKAIVGKEHSSRGDFTASEDDNVLVQGVSSDEHGVGFFGFAYYSENKDKLKIVPIDDGNDDNGAGAIAPSLQSVADGTYQPLSRPIFIYANIQAADARPEVVSFVHFYLSEGQPLVKEAGYIPLGGTAYDMVQKRFDNRIKGSLFEDGSKVGATVEELLSKSGS